MESNKDEAEKCLLLGRRYEAEGSLEQAYKFYAKSVRLYPTERGKKLLQEIEKKIQNPQAATSSPSSSSHRRQEEEEEEEVNEVKMESKVQYDREIVRIRKAKDYYDILQIERTATEVEIKKNYKKVRGQH